MKNLRNLDEITCLNKKSQSGFSLLELLISMFIGLFLLIGISTSYVSSKKSSITRDQVSILEDNGRIALEILTGTLQHTGYKSTGIAVLENPFMLTAGAPVSMSCGTDVSVVNPGIFLGTNINDNDVTGDSIGIVYLGDNNLNTDCSGGTLPPACRVGEGAAGAASRIYNAFFVDGDDNLQCAGSQSPELLTIAEGVENIQVLYGVNSDDDLLNSADRYVKASDVGVDEWGLIVSLQVAVLVRSLTQVKTSPESESFSLLDVQVNTPNDRFLRAVFSTSINLRNAN